VDRTESNREVTRGVYSEQLAAVIGEGAYDEAGHRNTQLLEATGIGPYPKEMQKAWNELRDEAADNYGFQEGFDEEEAREKMGPLAEPTPAVIRNRGAAERKTSRRAEIFVTKRKSTEADATGADDRRRREGDAHQQRQQEEGEDSEEEMDVVLEAIAEAISQAEREAAAARAVGVGEATLTELDTTLTGAASTREDAQEAEARRRADVFLQATRNQNG
jgi:hypothetical protein